MAKWNSLHKERRLIMAYTIIDQGSFTSDATSKKIDLPASADYMEVTNLTQATGTGSVPFKWFWYSNMADGDGMYYYLDGAHGVLVDTTEANGTGFYYRTTRPAPEAAVTGTTITAANPAVCTAAGHPYANGDRVRIYNNTVMKQISGMDFTVSGVAGDDFNLTGLDASGFAGAETGFSVRRLPSLAEVEPEALFITNITQAAQAVVTFGVAHPYVINQNLYFSVHDDFGMVEINGLRGKIVATSTYTVTVDIDSTGFTAFAFPLAGAQPVIYPMAGPDSQKVEYRADTQYGYNIDDVPYHSGQFRPYMLLTGGSSGPAGDTNDEIVWQAYKVER
jgi:hypothetical protein